MSEMGIMPTDQRIPPMGSEASETNFNETSYMDADPKFNLKDSNRSKHIPHYEYWKNSFTDLLNDPEGYKIFYEFLEKDKLVILFDCWYCCFQYRKSPPSKPSAKDIYYRFVKIKDPRIPISDQAYNNLVVRLKANDITVFLLEEIEKEVYGNLRDICYPKFLKSDFFNLYCETSGQIRYPVQTDLKTEKYEKPSKCLTDSNTFPDHGHEHFNKSHSRPDHDQHQHECQVYHDRVGYGPTSNMDDYLSSVTSDFDRSSVTDSKVSMGSGSRHGRPAPRGNNRDFDGPMDLANFKPRTQRISQDRLKQMKPTDFAALLTQKLEKVIKDRNDPHPDHSSHHSHGGDSMDMSSMKHNLPAHHSHQQRVPAHLHGAYDYDGQSECDAQSWVGMSDRPSVAGQSSHSGSHSGILVHKKAKELRDKVHHQLRSDLKECRCDHCRHAPSSLVHSGRHEHHERHHGSSSDHGYYPHSSNSNSYNYSTDTMQDSNNRYNTISSSHRAGGGGSRTSHHRESCQQQQQQQQQGDVAPPLDTSKIYSWMEKNERYHHKKSSSSTAYADPSPSPSLRRKKNPIQYNTSRQAVQPIAQDTGMPILPQPDPDNVLQEVKRKLEEPSNPHQQHQPQHHPRSSRQQHHHHHNNQQYDGYDKQSMASAPWSMSDNSSIVSYNPSQISTVPSSASRFWNAQGYFIDNNGSEARGDERCTPSEVQSHATSKHSGPRSVTRSGVEHASSARSDARSQSTGLSYGSDGSKGRSMNRTVVTYYYGSEPIPYRISVPTADVTLAQFKLDTKRGNFRFFFKTVSSVDGEVVWEEVKEDDQILPKYNDKIVGKVDKI